MYIRTNLLQQWLQYDGALPSDIRSNANNAVKEGTTQLPVILCRFHHQEKYYGYHRYLLTYIMSLYSSVSLLVGYIS